MSDHSLALHVEHDLSPDELELALAEAQDAAIRSLLMFSPLSGNAVRDVRSGEPVPRAFGVVDSDES